MSLNDRSKKDQDIDEELQRSSGDESENSETEELGKKTPEEVIPIYNV